MVPWLHPERRTFRLVTRRTARAPSTANAGSLRFETFSPSRSCDRFTSASCLIGLTPFSFYNVSSGDSSARARGQKICSHRARTENHSRETQSVLNSRREARGGVRGRSAAFDAIGRPRWDLNPSPQVRSL